MRKSSCLSICLMRTPTCQLANTASEASSFTHGQLVLLRNNEGLPFSSQYRLKPTELKTALLFKFSHQTLVDEILRFEAANLFVGCAEQPDDVADAIDPRINPLVV